MPTDPKVSPMIDQETLDISELDVWILSDGKPGHENQSLGVAAALGVENPKVIPLEKRPYGSLLKFFDPLLAVANIPAPPWPDVVIATGNLTVPVARFIKGRAPHVFTVQMMRPTGSLKAFDALAVPKHDNPKPAANIIPTTGAPNRITDEALKTAYKEWEAAFAHLPTKRLAVLIGGSSKHYDFTPEKAEKLAQTLKTFAKKQGYGLLVTTSRRTGAAQEKVLKDALEGPQTFFWNGEGANPYMGFLAHGEAIVATVDSVSMVSEGCSTGKPVYVFDLPALNKGKFGRFYGLLQNQKRIQNFDGTAMAPPPHPLADAAHVAGFVRGMLMRRHFFTIL